MKKFIVKIIIFIFLVFIADRAVGYVMEHVIDNIKVGGVGRDNYICNKVEDDMLIFGSSRAMRHYDSQMLEDSLNMSCYNCGEDGNGIFLNYGRLLMCKERKLPKVIIFDVAPTFDIQTNDNHKFLSWLRPRYERNGIRDIFADIDKYDNQYENIKMQSFLYRYNSRFLQNLVVYITNISPDTGIKGFRPVEGTINKRNSNINKYLDNFKVDSLKLHYINKFIDEAKNAKIIFVYSPTWAGSKPEYIAPYLEICEKRGFQFINFSNDPKYMVNKKYFKDNLHLNSAGANEFTKDLIKVLKEDSIIKL